MIGGRVTGFLDRVFGPPPEVQEQRALLGLVDEFREERARGMADMIEDCKLKSLALSRAKNECCQWREYALKLERLCLAHGIAMPPSPEE